MILIKVAIISFCCIISLNYFVRCADQHGGPLQKDTKSTTTTATTESTIYKIKRLHGNDMQQQQQQQQQQQLLQLQQKVKPQQKVEKKKQQQQYAHEQQLLQVALTTKVTNQPHQPEHQQQQQHQQQQHQQQQLQQQQQQQQQQQPQSQSQPDEREQQPPRTKFLKNLAKNSHRLNKKLLSKLGFTKVKAPNSHNRKRLAIESRRHASPDDSHMFIIKLPPNMYYYTSPKETNPKNAQVHHEQQQQSQPSSHQHNHQQQIPQTEKEVLNANGKKVSFPFSSNGKPGRIYHWNLPVIKKILEDKQRFPNVARMSARKDDLIDIKDIATWSKPWENETHDKSYSKSALVSYKKSLGRKSPSYYAPATAVNKNSFNKYFAGNGKPKGFYVIKENHKKPLYYKNIVS